MVRLYLIINLTVVVIVVHCVCVCLRVLRLMQHYIFHDISKASFHPTHKALRVEHISQFP